MDNALIYSLLVGIALVLLFVAARFALRWTIRLAIVGIILTALGAAAWAWLNHSSPHSNPRPVSRQRPAGNQQ